MPLAFAIGCHPDDIEFMMSGTLIRLKEAGCEIHYMNVANGSCGTDRLPRDEIVRIRLTEAESAARFIGAVFHPPLVNDIEVFYEKPLLARLGAVIRQTAPDILLTHSPNEYMEDHNNTCRLAVTAAFCRGMVNFVADPPVAVIQKPLTLYHSVPYGLTDALRRAVSPDIFVAIGDRLSQKRDMLAFHKSQKEWLDKSQGLDSYLRTMEEQCRKIGRMSGKFDAAEAFIRHSHLGFCGPDDDPLTNLLAAFVRPRGVDSKHHFQIPAADSGEN